MYSFVLYTKNILGLKLKDEYETFLNLHLHLIHDLEVGIGQYQIPTLSKNIAVQYQGTVLKLHL